MLPSSSSAYGTKDTEQVRITVCLCRGCGWAKVGQPFANNPTGRPATCYAHGGRDVRAGECGGHAAGAWFSASLAIPLNRKATHHEGGPHATLRDGAYRCTRTPVRMCACSCMCACVHTHVRTLAHVRMHTHTPTHQKRDKQGVPCLGNGTKSSVGSPVQYPFSKSLGGETDVTGLTLRSMLSLPPGWTPCAVHTPTLGAAEDRDGLGSETLMSQG